MPHLLSVRNLRTYFETRAGLVRAVDDVSFHIGRGEMLGLVGESGCGKSITALSIMRLISPPGRIVSGSIEFNGEELTAASHERMRKVRGNDIAMIFQDPMTSLNPVLRSESRSRRRFVSTGTLERRRPLKRRWRR